MASVTLVCIGNVLIFLIDLLVLVLFELSDYVLFIAESMESGVLE